MKKRVILLVLAVLSMAVISACSGDAPAASDSGSQSVNEVAEESTQTDLPEEKTEEAEPTSSPIGTELTLGDWSITASSFEFKTEIPDGYMKFSPKDSQSLYACVSVSVTNNGKSSATFLPSFGLSDDLTVKIIYGDGFEYSPVQLIAYSKNMFDTSLNPLTSKEGEINFEVPSSISESTDPLVLEFSEGGQTISYNLR